jgi:hypothetical protein
MKRLLITASLFIVFTVSLYAHHAAAGIDRSKTVTHEGTVKVFKWGNPHAWLDIDVPNGKGGSDVWSLEMTAPRLLVPAGWKSTTLKAGDKIKFTAYTFKNGDPGGIFVSVTLPDGRTLTERAPRGGATPAAGAAPAPASTPGR